MTRYEAELRAYGFPPEIARRDAHVNEIGRLTNREQYAREATQDGPPEPINSYEARRG
jgi:hypothetical protein